MKLFKRFFFVLQMLVTGLWKFIRDYAVSVIKFANLLVELADADDQDLLTEKSYKKQFADKLKYAEKFISTLIYAFVNACDLLIPNVLKELEKATHYNIIKAFIGFLKELNPAQRAMLLFKLASLMLVEILPEDKKIKENEADLLIQLTYSYNKHKTIV